MATTFGLLKKIPGAIAYRLLYEFQQIFTSRKSFVPAPLPTPLPSPSQTGASEHAQEANPASMFQNIIENYIVTTTRAMQIEMCRSPDAFYTSRNPLTKRAGKMFSQNEEDGITFEICRRIGISKGVFAEFGVEQGFENNTLALAALGWSGFWVGGEDLAFEVNPHSAKKLNFTFDKQWVTRQKLADIYTRNLGRIGQDRCNLISMDLDGNDYYFVEELLDIGATPEIFIVEYNASFFPPIEFVIDYSDNHTWKGDDYFGASLTSFYNLFQRHGYFLACCNITGSNAFFVRNDLKSAFADIPAELNELYEPPKYFFTGLFTSGHPLSPKTVEKIFSRLNREDS